ncbi:Protein of unknown function [Cotesia congregata]|uniref:Uncharacterized protein n=1 Tax=Cotesia congregata TaxID=51543 RepID=A0A8J2MDX8_COTCN|nr:Protein of unknown function [Cotesia congregata]
MAGVPPKEAKQQSLKRKASAQIMPKDNKTTRVTPHVIRNSFALEDAYKSWQKKNNNNNGSNNHAVKPNLNENRRRNSLPMVDKDGFQTVKNAAKVSLANRTEMAPPPVYNKFQLLDNTLSSNDKITNEIEMDTESVSQSPENNDPLSSSQSQQTEIPTVKSYRPPPIFVKGEKANATIGVLRSNNLDQEAFTITMSKGLHSVQAKNQTTFETIKIVLIKNNYQFYTFTPRGEKLKSLLLKGMSEDTTPEIVLEDLKAKNIPSVEFKKVSELKFKRDGEERRHLIVQITQTTGHPANYAGCTFLKFEKTLRKETSAQKSISLKKRIDTMYRDANPQISYANSMSRQREHFPPLTNRAQDNQNWFQENPSPPQPLGGQTSQAYRLQPQYQQQQQEQSQKTSNQEFQHNWMLKITSELSSLASAIKEMNATLNRSVTENKRRIDFLYGFVNARE